MILSIEDRVLFGNAMISEEQAAYQRSYACGNWMYDEYPTFRFISRELYGAITDTEFHRVLDSKKIPRQIDDRLWKAFLEAKE